MKIKEFFFNFVDFFIEKWFVFLLIAVIVFSCMLEIYLVSTIYQCRDNTIGIEQKVDSIKEQLEIK